MGCAYGPLCVLRLEQIQQISVALRLHLVVGDEAQGGTVDAITHTVTDAHTVGIDAIMNRKGFPTGTR